MSYEQQKKDLQQLLVGEELNKQLSALQFQVFGEEAEIIRNEEASGYFRYQNTQQYGIN